MPLISDLELLKETVLQWIDSCETDTQLDTCRRFVEQKRMQLEKEAGPGLFENIENAMVNKALTVKLTV